MYLCIIKIYFIKINVLVLNAPVQSEKHEWHERTYEPADICRYSTPPNTTPPLLAYKGWKTLYYFHIFGVEKSNFGKIKLKLGTIIRILEIIMLIYAKEMAQKAWKPLYFKTNWVVKTDFGNIKLSLGTKLRFLDMLVYAINGPK